jgi:hypothetical protein
MICPPCRAAGESNRNANEESPGSPVHLIYQEQARTLHLRCEHKATCPCHHHVGQILRTVPR